ncbi:MAG TPA: hypothetical protein VF607_14545, partial [Verrucomicrobiae bacterium]
MRFYRTSVYKSTRSRVAGIIGLGWLGVLPALATATNGLLSLHSINVNTRDLHLSPHNEISLGTYPEDVAFYFDHPLQPGATPLRIRTKLEGYDKDWREGAGEMHLAIQFFNDAGDLISQKFFNVSGSSAGWTGSLQTSTLTHRRETLNAPGQSARVMIIISSAGPPATLGIYAVANLNVAKSHLGTTKTIIGAPFDERLPDGNPDLLPPGWLHDGNRPSMARVVSLGREPATQAF